MGIKRPHIQYIGRYMWSEFSSFPPQNCYINNLHSEYHLTLFIFPLTRERCFRVFSYSPSSRCVICIVFDIQIKTVCFGKHHDLPLGRDFLFSSFNLALPRKLGPFGDINTFHTTAFPLMGFPSRNVESLPNK